MKIHGPTPPLIVSAATAVLLLLASTQPQVVNAKLSELTATPIEGAATDCSEPMFSVQLADDVLMSYVIKTPDDAVAPATISVDMEFDVETWVSFGYSPDDKGKMIGSEAIIGLPLDGTVQKYHMNSEKVEGVFPRAESEQTLQDSEVWQSAGKTYLRFTKELVEPGEIPINSQGINYFMWAYGYENELGLHDKKTGAGAFSLDVTSCVPPVVQPTLPPTDPPVEDVMVQDPTASPTRAPKEAVVADKEAAPVAEEEDEEKQEDEDDFERDAYDGPAVSSEEQEQLDCSDYQHHVQVDPKLSVYYVVNADEAGEHDGTISVKLEYQGNAWLALGVAENPAGKMIGSESVVALPDEPVSKTNPGEYHMISEQNEGVFLMEDSKQTLMDASIVQEDGMTIVTFTKLLSEEGKLGLTANGEVSTLLWAYGYSNDLNLHKATGAFRLTLEYCGGDSSGMSEVAFQALSKYTADQRRTMWFAHAILGLLAWAVLAPSAVAASWLRKLFQKWGAFWFKAHMYMNILVFILSIAAFAISVTMYCDESKAHFVGTHEAMGLALMLLVTFQAANGMFRPPAAPKTESTAQSSALVKARSPDGSDDEMGTEVSFVPPPPPPETSLSLKNEPGSTAPTPMGSAHGSLVESNVSPSKSTTKTKKIRAAWESIHKLLGVFLIFIGLWQVQSGIALYSLRFGTTNYSYVFWWCIGAFAAVVLGLTVYIRVKDV
eukprot:CAMPEP_0178580138 /NCGR_PEP_ID=MMETSP0697-20121206/22459_1 /TAXON_ID=265572 /ORGANISM="Extubocellulus spinifer, Strain CCMP396" /LENGTH=718 /DNA_ID=CAMNT_0020215639 /DNA_START=59 /DNA_END=2215 /DNA_ORIENTATION=-